MNKCQWVAIAEQEYVLGALLIALSLLHVCTDIGFLRLTNFRVEF